MTEWVAVGGGFIAGDVVRWSDGDWKRRGARGHGKSLLVGNRILTAQVLKEADEKGMVCFKVVACKVGLSRVPRREVEPVKVGAEIRRAYKNIVNGKPERLLWSDENNRALLSSRFLGNKEHEHFMAMETDEG